MASSTLRRVRIPLASSRHVVVAVPVAQLLVHVVDPFVAHRSAVELQDARQPHCHTPSQSLFVMSHFAADELYNHEDLARLLPRSAESIEINYALKRRSSRDPCQHQEPGMPRTSEGIAKTSVSLPKYQNASIFIMKACPITLDDDDIKITGL